MKSLNTLSMLLGVALMAGTFTAQAAKNIVYAHDPESESWVVVSLAGEEPGTKSEAFAAFEERPCKDKEKSVE